ncbi:hypothetical protein L2E82_22496 [Cichorium intybus]|uniref:Uncharacterized protein n=1 Tax=Cichorium intybus TaxID=13427 RepID=A0ACB9DXX4_CICIN|nr:hypothetical protein L2E82_22496 [Cichorium intybus]
MRLLPVYSIDSAEVIVDRTSFWNSRFYFPHPTPITFISSSLRHFPESQTDSKLLLMAAMESLLSSLPSLRVECRNLHAEFTLFLLCAIYTFILVGVGWKDVSIDRSIWSRIDYTLKAVGGSLTAIPGLSDIIDGFPQEFDLLEVDFIGEDIVISSKSGKLTMEAAGTCAFIDGTVPTGSGLSSSADFACSSTIAIMAALNVNLPKKEVAQLTY